MSSLKYVAHTKLKNKNLPPEVAGAWPILGHLPILDGQTIPLARILAGWADKYGPVFSIRLGIPRYMVVSSWEAVRDCFTGNDKVFAARPDALAGKYLGYNNARFSFSSYGPYWRKIRKLVVVELLSNRRLEKLKQYRIAEMESSIKELYSSVVSGDGNSPPVVDMDQWIGQLTLNLILKTIAGKRFRYKADDDGAEHEEAQHIINTLKKFFVLVGKTALWDAVPFPLFKWVDFDGHINAMKRLHREVDDILQGWIDEHVQRRKSRSGPADDRDFIDVMLSAIDDEFTSGHGYSRETIIKATVLSMILDGSDTTALHLVWLFSMMLNHGHTIKRAQDEIDAKIGRNRWVEESDIDNLPYLKAVIKESLRLYPPAPLLVPHEAVEDCYVAGYRVPKGTRLIVNAWKLHRDPRFWPEPEKFMPDRFLSTQAKLDASGAHFEYVPFGSGRRSCPGITYATLVAHLTVARLLQGFDFATPANEAVDLSEDVGVTMPKAKPLQVVITPRFTPEFYGF
ncbi:xanthotoxin 5-hydroxylase CYP82C4-like [Ipomoea triloba]|uniref:xanthotoxin 5-hydroxylase CYP82C4-like n=1 Tax=Ipomoea triloba TaxID=35885 RepID=UPI00125CF53D|nr:xanthotoxin 5-hydroxylase CYP82C4-like [Ipomoea triloba]